MKTHPVLLRTTFAALSGSWSVAVEARGRKAASDHYVKYPPSHGSCGLAE